MALFDRCHYDHIFVLSKTNYFNMTPRNLTLFVLSTACLSQVIGMKHVIKISENNDQGLDRINRRSFMKGLIILAILSLSLTAQAASGIKAKEIVAFKTTSGKLFSNLSLQESTKVLESLELDENIELREEIIYPEEVSEVVVGRLTKARITEKRPNPKDYN